MAEYEMLRENITPILCTFLLQAENLVSITHSLNALNLLKLLVALVMQFPLLVSTYRYTRGSHEKLLTFCLEYFSSPSVLCLFSTLIIIHQITQSYTSQICVLIYPSRYYRVWHYYSSLVFVLNCIVWRYVVLCSCSPYFANVQTTTTTMQLKC
jgi:hypothetical protein